MQPSSTDLDAITEALVDLRVEISKPSARHGDAEDAIDAQVAIVQTATLARELAEHLRRA